VFKVSLSRSHWGQKNTFPHASKIYISLIRLQGWMDEALRRQWMMVQQDQQISEAIEREKPRLRNFIRKRVADQSDAEDILQEVFYELVEA